MLSTGTRRCCKALALAANSEEDILTSPLEVHLPHAQKTLKGFEGNII